MDSGYIDNEFNYYKKDNFNNNLNFKLLIIILNIFFFISKSNNLYLKKYNNTQNEILRLENQILTRLNFNYYDKLKFLKIITNNNKKYYQGVENCLLNDPDRQLCLYHLLVPK